MSERRGRPSGDAYEESGAYEEPGAYDPGAGYDANIGYDAGAGHDLDIAYGGGAGYDPGAAYDPGVYDPGVYDLNGGYGPGPGQDVNNAQGAGAGHDPGAGYGADPLGMGPPAPAEPAYDYGYADPGQYAQPADAGYGYRGEGYIQGYVESSVQVTGYDYDELSHADATPEGTGSQGHGLAVYDGGGSGATEVMAAITAGDVAVDRYTDADTGYDTDADPEGGRAHDTPVEGTPAFAPDVEPHAARVPAQRGARRGAAEAVSRTPVWDPPGALPGLCTIGLAAALAVAATAGKPALAVAVVLLQVLTAVGWFRLNGMWPARQGVALAVLAVLVADVAVYAEGVEGLARVPAVLAVTMVVVLALQLRAGASPGTLLPALTVTASAALVSVFGVAYVVAWDIEGGPVDPGAAVVPAVLAVGVAILVRAVPLPSPVGAILGWLVGAGAGAVVGASLGGETPAAAALGAGAAALGLLGHRMAGYDHPSRFVHFTAGVSLPLVLAAPSAYLLGRVMIG